MSPALVAQGGAADLEVGDGGRVHLRHHLRAVLPAPYVLRGARGARGPGRGRVQGIVGSRKSCEVHVAES